MDDDPDMRGMLRAIVEPLGQAATAADGAEAMEALARERPDLIFLDVAMPGEDGLSVLGRVRAADPGVAVVMLTGETDLAVARTALERGARSYITKPFDPETIRAEVLRFAGGPRTRGDEPPWRVTG